MTERTEGGFEEPPILLREELVWDRIDANDIALRPGNPLRAINLVDAANAVWETQHDRHSFIATKLSQELGGHEGANAEQRLAALSRASESVSRTEGYARVAVIEGVDALESQGETASVARLLSVIGINYQREESEPEGTLTVNSSPDRDEIRVNCIRQVLEELHLANINSDAAEVVHTAPQQ